MILPKFIREMIEKRFDKTYDAENDFGIELDLVSGSSFDSNTSDLFESLFGNSNELDFASGNLMYNVDVDANKKNDLKLFRSFSANPGSFPLANEMFKKLLENETTMDVNANEIAMFSERTRDTIDSVLIEKCGDRVGLPVPTWNFWDNLHNFDRDGFNYFLAHNEDEFISNFNKESSSENLNSLLLVSNPNPLPFQFSESGLKEINAISQKYGVQVIVDDLLRGIQAPGKRDSIARYFDMPIVIEGLSHRLGEESGDMANTTFVYTPGQKLDWAPRIDDKISRHAGLAIQTTYDASNVKIYEELKTRNKIVKTVLENELPDVELIQSFDSSITSLLKFPNSYGSLKKLIRHCYKDDIKIVPLVLFYPDMKIPTSFPEGSRMMRLSVGNVYSTDMVDSIEKLTNSIKNYKH